MSGPGGGVRGHGRTGIDRGLIVLAAAFLVLGVSAVGPAGAGKLLTRSQANKLFHQKADVYPKGEMYAKGEVYPKEQLYSKEVSDTRFVGMDGSAADTELLDGTHTATASTPGSIYVSDTNGDLPANTVDAAAVADLTRVVPIPIHTMDEDFTVGTFPDKVLVGDAPALAFGDSTDEEISFVTVIPGDMVGSSVTLRVRWAAVSTTGKVRWVVRCRSLQEDEAADSAPDLFDGNVYDPSGTSGGLTTASISVNTAPGNVLWVNLERDALSAPADTLAGDARLFSVDIAYTATQ